MTTLVIARHGNTFRSGEPVLYVGAASDLPLTERGEEQALLLAQRLQDRGLKPDLYYAGVLRRQRHTANLIASYFGYDPLLVHSAPALQEFILGPWEGKTKEEIEANYASELANWENSFVWPKGIFPESPAARTEQLLSWLANIADSFPQANVLAITSNGVLRLLYSLYGESLSKRPWNDLCQEGKAGVAKVKTGHYCVLELLGSGLVEIREWNVSCAPVS